MTEREEQVQGRADELRLPWIRPELRRLDAGDAELGGHVGNDYSGTS